MSQNTGLLSNQLEKWRLRQIRRFMPKHRISMLDIGCGRATILHNLHNVGEYTGVDLLTDTIAENQKKYPKFIFINGDILTADLPQNSYNVVIMSALIEHLNYDDNIELLKRISDLLQAGGIIIGTTPHRRSELIHTWGAKIGLFSREAAEEHKCLFDKDLLIRLAKETGFEMSYYNIWQMGFNQIFVYEKLV